MSNPPSHRSNHQEVFERGATFNMGEGEKPDEEKPSFSDDNTNLSDLVYLVLYKITIYQIKQLLFKNINISETIKVPEDIINSYIIKEILLEMYHSY